jgi:hypothetical protein
MEGGVAHFHWAKYNGSIPSGTVYAGDNYVVARALHNHEWMPGKLHTTTNQAYVPYGGKEIEVKEHIEILVANPGSIVEWVPMEHGQAGNVGPYGQDGLFVGRAKCPEPENTWTPGKIHPVNKKFYIPWGGEEKEFTHYEGLVIKGLTHHWDKFNGVVPMNAVKAGDNYYVARAYYNNEWIPGKLHTTEYKTYIPWGSKEHEVTGSDIEILVAGAGTTVEWVPAKDGYVPPYTVGPMGNDGLFVGRAKCPHPENIHTPGKIHPINKKFYLPWGGKEVEHHEYEALVIRH